MCPEPATLEPGAQPVPVTVGSPAMVDANSLQVDRPRQTALWATIAVIVAMLLLLGIFSFINFRTNKKATPNVPNQSVSLNPTTPVTGLSNDQSGLRVAGDLTVTGATRLQNGLSVSGEAVFSGDVTISGNITAANFPGPGGSASGLGGQAGAAGARGATGAQGPAGLQGPSGTATCPNGPCLSLQSSSPGVQEAGGINISGNVISGNLLPGTAGVVGSGAVKTSLNGIVGGCCLYDDSVQWSAIGPDGFVRYLYFDNGSQDLHFVRCSDIDCTARTTTLIASSVNDVDFPTVVMGTDGFMRIAYTTYDTFVRLIRCTNADCTTKTDTAIASGGAYYSHSIALGADGLVRIVYADYNTNDFIFVRCTNADCSTNVTTTLINGSYDYSSVSFGPDGFARIAYEDYTTRPDHLGYIHCLNANCTSKNITTVTGSSVHAIYHISSATGTDGFTRIAYAENFGSGASKITYVRCTNADCTTSVVTTIDSTNDTGRDLGGMVLGSDGFARMVYDYGSGGGVYYVECLNDNCTNKSTAAIESRGVYGYPNSLTLGPDGLGRIVYFENDNRTYHFARLTTNSGNNEASGSAIGSASAPYGAITATSLQLQGDLASSLNIKNGAGTIILNVDSSTGALTLNNASGTNIIQATASGNLGVGNPSPVAKLDIKGNVATVPGLAIQGATASAVVTNKQLSSNVGTITTSAAHGFVSGSRVSISGMGAPFDGTWDITNIPTTTTFTFNDAAADVPSQAASGSVIGDVQTADLLQIKGGNNTTNTLLKVSRSGQTTIGWADAVVGNPPALSNSSTITLGAGQGVPNGFITISGDPSIAYYQALTVKGAHGTYAVTSNAGNNYGGWLSAYNYDQSIQYGSIGVTSGGGIYAVNGPGAPTAAAFVVQGASGQTGNLFQAQDSTTAVLASIDSSGNLSVKNAVVTGTLTVNGSIATALVNKTSGYVLTATDSVVTADATSGVFNLTLPTAVGIKGRQYTLKKIDASANAVTVNTTSSQTIDGVTTYSLPVRWKFVIVVSDGTNWVIVGQN